MTEHNVTINMLAIIAALLITSRAAGQFSLKLGMPPVFGELLLGLLVGPAVLNLVHPSAVLETLAQMGAIVLMFVAGLETDVSEMRKVGKAATIVAVVGVIIPFVLGTGLGLLFGLALTTSIFLGTILTATSVGISAQVLRQLGRLRSREGSIIMGAAVIDDVLGVAAFSVVLAMVGSGNLGVSLLKMVIFFPVAWVFGSFMIPWLVRLEQRLAQRADWLGIGLGCALLFAWAAEMWGGVSGITGAYLAGVLVARAAHKDHIVFDGMSALGSGLVVPLFFVSVGLVATPEALVGAPALTIALVAIAVVSKVLGCGAGALMSGLNRQSSMRIGIGMMARGEVALVIAVAGRSAGLINDTIFGASVIMALATTLLTPPLLKLAYRNQEPAREAATLPQGVEVFAE
jgi:Kef-type K+ transport system membrane component KefB